MKTIYCQLSIGYPTAMHTDEIEVEDDATPDEIETLVEEWAWEHINISHQETPFKSRFR